jgi:hypothetical protein
MGHENITGTKIKPGFQISRMILFASAPPLAAFGISGEPFSAV